VPVNIRVIAATHAPLEQRVREGRFRDDLYYRLNGAHFALPPLRDRSDLSVMIDRLLAAGDARQPPVQRSPAARALLLAHRWPGNLRELRNALDYARSVCSHGLVEPTDLPDALQPEAGAPIPQAGLAQADLLLQQLRDAHWNVAAVARKLGCARMTLYRRMARWGIRSPNARDGSPPAR
jgi:transcriptional regulator of acetoin/glycerol metabolism